MVSPERLVYHLLKIWGSYYPCRLPRWLNLQVNLEFLCCKRFVENSLHSPYGTQLAAILLRFALCASHVLHCAVCG